MGLIPSRAVLLLILVLNFAMAYLSNAAPNLSPPPIANSVISTGSESSVCAKKKLVELTLPFSARVCFCLFFSLLVSVVIFRLAKAMRSYFVTSRTTERQFRWTISSVAFVPWDYSDGNKVISQELLQEWDCAVYSVVLDVLISVILNLFIEINLNNISSL